MSESYPVNRLLRSKKTKKGTLFLVEWGGINPATNEAWANSWQIRKNITKDALDEFYLRKKRKKKTLPPRKAPRAVVPFNSLNFQKIVGYNTLDGRLQFTVQATVRVSLHELPAKLRKEYRQNKAYNIRSKHHDTSCWPRIGSNYQADIPSW
jgi:hypothetical protein